MTAVDIYDTMIGLTILPALAVLLASLLLPQEE